MNQEKNDTKSLIFASIGIIAIVLAYFLIDFNTVYQSLKGEAKFVTQDKACDLHLTNCAIKIQDGTTFDLDIEPKTIPLMKPMKFSFKSNNSKLKDLYLEIYAVNMFMGEFKIPIKNLGEGNYEAIVTLPTCPIGNMQWNAEIRVEKLNETIGARFQFKTDKI